MSSRLVLQPRRMPVGPKHGLDRESIDQRRLKVLLHHSPLAFFVERSYSRRLSHSDIDDDPRFCDEYFEHERGGRSPDRGHARPLLLYRADFDPDWRVRSWPHKGRTVHRSLERESRRRSPNDMEPHRPETGRLLRPHGACEDECSLRVGAIERADLGKRVCLVEEQAETHLVTEHVELLELEDRISGCEERECSNHRQLLGSSLIMKRQMRQPPGSRRHTVM